MAFESDYRKTYMGLGLLDFLAYYVPGILFIISIVIVTSIFESNYVNVLQYFTELQFDPYVKGATWTLLLFIVPFVLGHIIFPIGYPIARFFFTAKPKLEGQETKGKDCDKLKDTKYCKQESMEFAECVFLCYQNNNFAFNDLMITRFRTLSRFCRAMLVPCILLSISILIVALSQYNNIKLLGLLSIIFISMLLLFAGFAFGLRHRRYENRWRNAVCIGSAILT